MLWLVVLLLILFLLFGAGGFVFASLHLILWIIAIILIIALVFALFSGGGLGGL